MLTQNQTRKCFQLMINSYEGNHGTICRTSDNEQDLICSQSGFDVEFTRSDIGNDVYFCFQGTQDIPDWWKNIQKHTTRMFNVDVHNGFHDMFAIFYERYYRKYEKNLIEKNVIFTGHSQGAAIATLAAFYRKESIGGKLCGTTHCVPIASPRVGKKNFIKRFNEILPGTKVYRFGWDIVTTVPWEITGYRHVGELVQLGKQRCRPSALDHYPSKYIKAFDRQIMNQNINKIITE